MYHCGTSTLLSTHLNMSESELLFDACQDCPLSMHSYISTQTSSLLQRPDALRRAGKHLVVDAIHGLSIHAIKLPRLPQQGVLKHALQHAMTLKDVCWTSLLYIKSKTYAAMQSCP